MHFMPAAEQDEQKKIDNFFALGQEYAADKSPIIKSETIFDFQKEKINQPE